MLQDLISTTVTEIAKGTIPAVAVYFLTQRSISKHKEQTQVAKDEAKKEIAGALNPALQLFKAEFTNELLEKLRAIYMPTRETELKFDNMAKSISRLEYGQEELRRSVTQLAAGIGRRKTDTEPL